MIDHTATAPAPATPAPAPPQAQIAALDPAALVLTRARTRQANAAAHARHVARLARLRLCSYCLTLAACVLALMSFMYLTQGTADGDRAATWLGAMFVVSTALTLWLAVRITRVGDVAAH